MTFWGPDFEALQSQDPEIASVVLDELGRLRGGLLLIASENVTSPAVLAALGSTLSNKYAEGYPDRRYYGGCAEAGRAEEIGIARAKELFGAEVSFSGTWFTPVPAHFVALVAGGAIPSPVPHADVVTFTYRAYAQQVVANASALAAGLADQGMRPVSGGTDTHLALVDLQPLGVTGAAAETRCDAARITVNKNAIPYDPQKPTVASGLQVGTAAVIARGVADADGTAAAEIAREVGELVAANPAYPEPAQNQPA